MIKLERVNKYFNRFKKNELHVVKNSSIELNNTGLVAILGPSGCGKTTLLNLMGGLDKVSSGNIYIDGKKITRRSSKKVDEIRNLNVGYIFQDYKLVESMTVYENVALSLKILGIKDKEEIKKRIMYTLDKVKMSRFKNRPVSMLSGGERQRVGIARALVKNPKIIIADEPTGNLDSKNSLEIMNIIKSISNKYLVILVTHEVDLAKFYADRVIELKDGLIVNDYENTNSSQLNYEIDNRIYLKEYKNITNLKKDNVNIDVYKDDLDDVNIKIVFKNNSIYIENKGNEKIEVVDSSHNIELIDDYKQQIKNTDIVSDFDIESVINKEYKNKYSSIFHLGSFIKDGFIKVRDYNMIKKILLIGFFLSGMFINYAISSSLASVNIEDKDFVTMNKEYLTAKVSNISLDTYLEMEKLNEVEYILPSNSIVNLKFKYDKYLQTQGSMGLLSGSLSSINLISKDDLILGRMPSNNKEIVIDKMVVEKFIKDGGAYKAGFEDAVDLLNHQVYLDYLEFIIVGITDLEENTIYTNKENFINIINSNVEEYNMYDDIVSQDKLIDYNLAIDSHIKLVKGHLPLNDYEVLVNEFYEYDMPLNKEINTMVNKHKLKVVGYYKNTLNNENYVMYTNNNTIKYQLITKTKYLSVLSNDKEDTINYFNNKMIDLKDSYKYSLDNYIYDKEESIKGTLITSSVILGISLIEILLMIRSSFLSRVKEVGIYRAIGVKKSDIYKMFTGEIIAITILASFTGISFMTYILYNIGKISYLQDMFMVNIFTYIISLLLVLIFNIIVGLIPVYNTIRKTPAEILSRHDID